MKANTNNTPIELIKAGDVFYHGEIERFFVLDQQLTEDGRLRLIEGDKEFLSLVYPIKQLTVHIKNGTLIHLSV